MPEETLGGHLRRQRELRNISLEEVASGTKIGIHNLEAIEEERWESLPAEVFVRGFIRSYAEHVGLDPEEVMLRYEAEHPPRPSEREGDAGVAAGGYPKRQSRRPPGLLLAFLGIVLLAAVVAAYWLFLRTPDPHETHDTSSVTRRTERGEVGGLGQPPSAPADLISKENGTGPAPDDATDNGTEGPGRQP